MKKLFLFLAITPILLFGQNFEPTQRQFLINTQTGYYGYLSGDSAYFQQKRFITGNHWDHSSRLGDAVGYNQMGIYNLILFY